MPTPIAHGVFTWAPEERCSDRYGFFTVQCVTYHNEFITVATINHKALQSLVGKKVKITAVVTQTRESGHVGDLFHKIYPSTPKVGARVNLGVGILALDTAEWVEHQTSIGLRPVPLRDKLWIDPRKFYKLHDQTVEVYVQESLTAFTAAPKLTPHPVDEIKRFPDEGRFLQFKGKPNLQPTVEGLGDGLFMVKPPPISG